MCNINELLTPADGGQPTTSFGSGQLPRPQQHSRPFFYVQPASQPYVPMYQHWHVNNPYNPYGMPGGISSCTVNHSWSVHIV